LASRSLQLPFRAGMLFLRLVKMLLRLCLSVALAAALPSPGWSQQKKAPRRADIEILRIISQRQEGRIHYEGAWKLTGAKPVAGLVMRLDFYESRGVLLSVQSIRLEEATLRPGEEKEFQVQGKDVPRAVSFRISATDSGGRDLTLAGDGPYPLD